jgi:hypothetical protein
MSDTPTYSKIAEHDVKFYVASIEGGQIDGFATISTLPEVL